MRRILLIAVMVTLAAGLARADRVRTKAGIGYTGSIEGLDAEGLVLKGPAGVRSIPLADVERIEVDDIPALEKAEATFAGAEAARGPAARTAFEQAERQYEAVLRRGPPRWLKTLIQARLYRIYAATGRVRRAMEAYVALAEDEPSMVVGFSLPRPREGADAENRALLKVVDGALARARGKPYAKSLQALRLALVMEVGTPEERRPLLEEVARGRNPRLRVWAQMRLVDLLIETKDYEKADERIETAAEALGAEHAGWMAFARGRVLEAKGEHVDAALSYMRVPVLHARSDPARTAEALFRAGQAMEAANLPATEIRNIYQEAVRDYAGTSGAERSRRALVRLGAG